MKNVTLLRQSIREVLEGYYCNHAPNNEAAECDVCAAMVDDIIAAVGNWRIRAYKTTKGKI